MVEGTSTAKRPGSTVAVAVEVAETVRVAGRVGEQKKMKYRRSVQRLEALLRAMGQSKKKRKRKGSGS